MTTVWPWITLALLGAWHGANPGMGWLFAVSRGLQERRGAAVIGALWPIALGHAFAVALPLVVFTFGHAVLPVAALRWGSALVVIGFGLARLVKHRHPRWVGMRVGFRDLTWWSFLMATAHGAGLMLVPLFVVDATPSCHTEAGIALNSAAGTVVATVVHTAAMLTVTGVIALTVYHRLGLSLLRRTWFNLDWLWSLALVVSGVIALVMTARGE